MTANDEFGRRMHRLGNEVAPDVSVVEEVIARISRNDSETASEPLAAARQITKSQNRILMVAAAVVAMAAILAGPLVSVPDHDQAKWWLDAPAACAQTISQALQTAIVQGVTARETTIFIMRDGSRHESSTVGKYFVARDRYRRDMYDAEKLQSRQWYVPDGEGMVETGLRYDSRTYTVLRHDGGFGEKDPIERMRFLVHLAAKADSKLPPRNIEGRQCVGFEISASKYGSNPEGWQDRVWFDIETKLPVRIERKRPCSEAVIIATIHVQHQFNWNPHLPLGTFAPSIPKSFRRVSENRD